MSVIKNKRLVSAQAEDFIYSLAERPTAASFGIGSLIIVGVGYRVECKSDGVSWTSTGSSDSIADRPSAALFGKGTWQVGGIDSYLCNGHYWTTYTKFNPSQLKKWRAALSTAMSGGADAKIMIIGDSTSNGAYAAGASIGDGAYPFTEGAFLARILSAKGLPINIANRMNFMGPGAATAASLALNDPRWSVAAGWTPTSGMLRNTADLTDANFTPLKPDGVTAEVFDTIVIKYVKSATYAAIEVAVDGGAVAGTSVQSGTDSVGTVTVTVPLLAHTVNIRKVAADIAKTVYILSINCYNSTKSEVQLLINGFNNYKSSDFSALTNYGYLTHVNTYAPHLSILNCSINDIVPQTALATYKANIQTVITNCKLSGDVILRTGTSIQNGYSTYVTGNEIPYLNTLYDLAEENNLPIIDIHRDWVSWVDANAIGLITNAAHPNKIGYNDVANLIAPYVLNY